MTDEFTGAFRQMHAEVVADPAAGGCRTRANVLVGMLTEDVEGGTHLVHIVPRGYEDFLRPTAFPGKEWHDHWLLRRGQHAWDPSYANPQAWETYIEHAFTNSARSLRIDVHRVDFDAGYGL